MTTTDPGQPRPDATGTEPPPDDGEVILSKPDDSGIESTDGGTVAVPPTSDPGRQISWLKVVIGIALAAVAVALPLMRGPTDNEIFSRILFLAVAAAGLNLLTGFTGQISIGHGAFFGIGAFTTAILIEDYGWPFEATIAVAAVLAAVVGVAVGFPALRVRGLYLALVTLGLAVLFPTITRKFVKGTGDQPFVEPPRSSFNSLIPGLDRDQYQYYVCLIAVVVTFVLAYNLVNSRMGRAMVATRDQELAAATVGVNLARVKVSAFAVSAAYAGVAGSLSVPINRFADGTNPLLYFQLSIEFLIAVVIGGSATVAGPLVGAIFLVVLRNFIEDQVETREFLEGKEVLAPAILGMSLVAAVYVLPQGIVGGFRRLMARVAARRSPTSTGSGSEPQSSTPETPKEYP